jgi:cytochrome c-type biogenesis protein CcmH/NrfF
MKKILILLFCLLPTFSYAGEAKDLAADPVLEKRMIGLAENLRCLVCQNESLASSHAELAEDLRREVREQMAQGKVTRKSWTIWWHGMAILFCTNRPSRATPCCSGLAPLRCC